jgi:hypothetical protein
MNQEQEQALLESIKHWKDNVALEKANEPIDPRSYSCACCQLQVKRQGDDLDFDCFHKTGNCVIAEYTGKESCEDTPYYLVVGKMLPAEVMVAWLQQLYDYKSGKTEIGPYRPYKYEEEDEDDA